MLGKGGQAHPFVVYIQEDKYINLLIYLLIKMFEDEDPTSLMQPYRI